MRWMRQGRGSSGLGSVIIKDVDTLFIMDVSALMLVIQNIALNYYLSRLLSCLAPAQRPVCQSPLSSPPGRSKPFIATASARSFRLARQVQINVPF